MKKALFLLLSFFTVSQSRAQTKPAELLLLGTFHFHNPGADLVKVKTFDVMTPKVQAELETITDKITLFHPDKIFVEWPWDKQQALDEGYAQYLSGKYEDYLKRTDADPATRDANLRSETVQLAFRAGKKAKLTRIYAFDYPSISLPFDTVMKSIAAAHQDALLASITALMKSNEAAENKKRETYTLTQLLLDINTPQRLAANKSAYIEKFNRAGSPSNFSGAQMVSEWYRRNLYMYSLLQKTVVPTDKAVLVLLGFGHAAMLEDFVEHDSAFKLKALKDVLK
jgi:hypothetical protein